jgi:hypothetical protein
MYQNVKDPQHFKKEGGGIIVGRSYVLNIKMLKKRSFFTIRSLRSVYIPPFTCEESVEGRVGRTTFSARF